MANDLYGTWFWVRYCVGIGGIAVLTDGWWQYIGCVMVWIPLLAAIEETKRAR